MDNVPPAGASTGKVLLIVFSIVGFFLLLMALACGGLIYWGYTQIKDMPAAQTAAEAFFNDLAAGNVDAAYERTTKAFQTAQPLPQFRKFVDGHPALRMPNTRALSGLQINAAAGTAQVVIRGSLSAPNGSLTYTVTLVQEGAEWKVQQFTIP